MNKAREKKLNTAKKTKNKANSKYCKIVTIIFIVGIFFLKFYFTIKIIIKCDSIFRECKNNKCTGYVTRHLSNEFTLCHYTISVLNDYYLETILY